MTKLEKLEKAAAETAVKDWFETGLIEEEVMLNLGGGEQVYSFDALAIIKDQLDIKKKEAERQLRVVADALLLMMNAREERKVALWDGMTFEVRTGKTASKLEPTKLLEHGVALEVIQASIVPGDEYQYVQINRPKVVVR